MSDRDPSIASLGRMLQEYRAILTEENLMDFSSIQIEAYRLLCDHEDILNELRSAITHIMVDEYQNTNYIQEQLVFLLAEERKNMFTSNQGDLSVHYYDPESGRIRQYYPDFLAKMTDGSYQLIEVKGDNKIDDTVVKAKKAAAEEMAVASGVKYLMYASSQVMHTHILEEGAATTQNMLY